MAKESIKGGGNYDRGPEYYSQALGFNIEILENQDVLDLGASKELQFARGLKRMGIKPRKIVSLSPAFADKRWRDSALAIDDTIAHQAIAGLGEQLPFANETFDTVVCLNLVQHLTHEKSLEDLVEEISRVLKKDGLAMISPVSVDEGVIKWDYTAGDSGPVRGVQTPIAALKNISSGAELTVKERPPLDLNQAHKYFTLVLKKPAK